MRESPGDPHENADSDLMGLQSNSKSNALPGEADGASPCITLQVARIYKVLENILSQ